MIYCSLSCIIRHANESLKIIAKEKSKTLGHKSQDTVSDKLILLVTLRVNVQIGKVTLIVTLPIGKATHIIFFKVCPYV